jgi:PDZ domain-containing secreted protein
LNDAKTNFIEEKLDENNNFFDTKNNYFESVVIEDFFDYLNNTSKYSQLSLDTASYSSEQKDKIALQLKNEVIKIKVSADVNSNTLLKLLESNNNIDTKDTEQLKEEIKNLSNKKTLEFIKSDLKRSNFLQGLELSSTKEKYNAEKLK